MIPVHRMIAKLIYRPRAPVSRVCQEHEFPDLETFKYQIAVLPDGATLRAWNKYQECERRLAIYRWAEGRNDPAQPRQRVLLDDCESAIFLTFEATLQLTKNEFPKTSGSFDRWLQNLPAYDIAMRGIRTLRHLEAHVEASPASSTIVAVQGSSPSLSRTWRLKNFTDRDPIRLRSCPLEAVHLAEWNALVNERSAKEVFKAALLQLGMVLRDADTIAQNAA